MVVFFLIAVLAGQSTAELPPIPSPEPDPVHANLFYGAIPAPAYLPPDVGKSTPLLVFVHGVGGTAMHWWNGNDMYEIAYWNGYRTAFINTDKMYIIGHSKGGVDIQAAMLDPDTANLVKAVFTISSPNHGTELADWAFEHPDLSGPLNMLSPAVESLKTANMAEFRSLADPILKSYGIPFYFTAGVKYTDNPLTLITGSILRALVPGPLRDDKNDGFVTVARTRLPDEYAADLGTLPFNHFATNSGSVTFPQILGRIQGLELALNEFNRIAAGGFSEFGGSAHNTWIWSAKWFKGELYVGTGREVMCVSMLISDANTGTKLYPLEILSGHCPDYLTFTQSLGAEIWRYTPDTGQWTRVFKSPDTIPVAFDEEGNPTLFTARDIGFRGMTVFTEQDGMEALYVGGVTSGGVFDPFPFGPKGYPPPRLLRTTDGTNWTPVPQDPGTFLGEIGNMLINPETKFRSFRSLPEFPETKFVSFRSLRAYKGKLFATLGDFIGSGVILASDNPSAGNDAWQQVSPPRSEFPVWTLTVFNDNLYATTGLTQQQDPTNPGYGVYKTDAEGDPPYTFTPVVVNGGHQPNEAFRAPNGLSFAEFNGQLYMGTNRPTELIRINPDDTWDLVVGEPRNTPQGYKAPISGFGNGFASGFNGHFWRMASFNGNLYLGTWDWSSLLQGLSLITWFDRSFSKQYGFDLFRTDDGIHWSAITQTGMGVPNRTGVRSLEPTPVGLFMGTAGGNRHGADVFVSTGPFPANALPAPKRLKAASESEVGRTVMLSWEPCPGAVRYLVYRATSVPLPEPTSETETSLTLPVSDGRAISALNAWTPFVFPLGFRLIDIVSDTTFTEPAPTDLQSVYFVRTQDAQGNLSDLSNSVGAPSKAEPERSCSRRSR
jgi:pimeloyl-ACP methyl ester carboxylesterase